MSARDLKTPSKTDWARVDALTDADIDAEGGELGEDFFDRAELSLPAERVRVTLELDAAVLAWFRTQDDPEARLRAALKLYADAHKTAA